MIPLKYQKNSSKEKYYELIIRSRDNDFIGEIDYKCWHYLRISFKHLVCAWPEELEQLHFDLKKLPNYEQIKKEFKSIASSKENNYIVNTLFKRMPREAKLMIYEQTEQNVCPYCNRNFTLCVRIVVSERQLLLW